MSERILIKVWWYHPDGTNPFFRKTSVANFNIVKLYHSTTSDSVSFSFLSEYQAPTLRNCTAIHQAMEGEVKKEADRHYE